MPGWEAEYLLAMGMRDQPGNIAYGPATLNQRQRSGIVPLGEERGRQDEENALLCTGGLTSLKQLTRAALHLYGPFDIWST